MLPEQKVGGGYDTYFFSGATTPTIGYGMYVVCIMLVSSRVQSIPGDDGDDDDGESFPTYFVGCVW